MTTEKLEEQQGTAVIYHTITSVIAPPYWNDDGEFIEGEWMDVPCVMSSFFPYATSTNIATKDIIYLYNGPVELARVIASHMGRYLSSDLSDEEIAAEVDAYVLEVTA